MAFKFNFFARPIDTDYSLPWESLAIEFSLGIICTVMAKYGWDTGMMLMAAPAAIVAFTCFGLAAYTLIGFIQDRRKTM